MIRIVFREIAEEFTVSELCQILNVSRSGYYAFLKSQKEDKNMEFKQLIRETYLKYDGKYGYRQIQLFLLQDYGVWANHKKVLRLMQIMNLRSRIRRKHRINYKSSIGGRVGENLLQRQFYANQPNKIWGLNQCG